MGWDEGAAGTGEGKAVTICSDCLVESSHHCPVCSSAGKRTEMGNSRACLVVARTPTAYVM